MRHIRITQDAEIPNSIILYIYVLSLASNNLIFERITRACLIPAFPLFFIALKYDGIQGGDVKFLSAVGAYLGLFNLALVSYPDNRNGGRVELCEVREKRSACNCILYRVHNL